jgi:hypothetical protein
VELAVSTAVHVALMREVKNACDVLVGKPEGKRPLRRPKHRWEDNTRMDVRHIDWEDVYRIHLAQDREQ